MSDQISSSKTATAADRLPAAGNSGYASDTLVNTILSDTYRIVKVLGEGGMGRVYEAQHTRITSKRFAVKVLHPEFARRAEVLERFQREVEATASIHCPHVIDVYDVGATEDGRPYLVSELLHGEDLADRLDRVGSMPVPEAVHIVRQVCMALDAAHASGVVHRDIKPENIFLLQDCADANSPSKKCNAKVLDFGISRIEGKAGNTLTKTGMVVGTPSYMAPEQARGEKIDHRVDIYGAGALLYHAVTGVVPFDRGDATATLAAVLTEEPERPRALAPNLPEHLELIIQQAMARDPDSRYQSIDDLRAALISYDLPDAEPATHGAAYGNKSHPSPAARATMRSERDKDAIRSARPQFILLTVVVALAGALAIMTVAEGAIRLNRHGPAPTVTGTEALIIVLVVLMGFFPPAIYFFLRTKRYIWQNTAKVVQLLGALRDPLLFGLATSGFVAVCLRAITSLVLRSRANAAGAAWDLVVPLSGLLAAGGSALWGRLPDRLRRSTGGAAGVLLVALFGGGLVAGVYQLAHIQERWRTENAEHMPATEALTDRTGIASAPRVAGSALGKKRLPQAFTATYVWRKLLKQVQNRSTAPAIDSLERLLALDPEAANDKDVRDAIVTLSVQAFFLKNDLTRRMEHLLTQQMGASGPDVLFALIVSKPGTAAALQAERLLRNEAVVRMASGAMRIAYGLRKAESCDEKRVYLSQAIKIGDLRALVEIRRLQKCKKASPCCLKNDPDAADAIKAIIKRGQTR